MSGSVGSGLRVSPLFLGPLSLSHFALAGLLSSLSLFFHVRFRLERFLLVSNRLLAQTNLHTFRSRRADRLPRTHSDAEKQVPSPLGLRQ